MKSECQKRKQEKLNNIPPNRFKTWLNIWSMHAMLTVIVVLFISPLHAIYTICKYVNTISIYTWLLSKVSITFYQIARLQYCFSVHQIHSKKYGYSKCIFIILYTMGFILILLSTYMAIYLLTFATWSVKYNICIVKIDDIHQLISVISILVYCLWDWSVLILYIIKIIQFYCKKSNDVTEQVLIRIKFILQRIFVLMLIVGISGSFSIFSNNYSNNQKDVHVVWDVIARLMPIIDSVLSISIIYLMIEHNTKEYIKFIKILNTFKLCICCNSFIGNVLKMETKTNISNNNKNKNNDEDTIYNTMDMSLPGQIEIEMSGLTRTDS